VPEASAEIRFWRCPNPDGAFGEKCELIGSLEDDSVQQGIRMSSHLASFLSAIVPVAVQFVLFLRWLHRRMRDDEIVRAFVRDIATNHLPHIYCALQQIAKQQGIELDETPLVRFVEFNGHGRSR
jgi:hypothetical protein